MSEVDRMDLIERTQQGLTRATHSTWLCPIHLGEHPGPGSCPKCRRVLAEYVPARQLAEAVERIEKLEALLAQAYRVVGSDELAANIEAALEDYSTAGGQ